MDYKPSGVCSRLIHVEHDGARPTSCPDQLSKALKQALGE